MAHRTLHIFNNAISNTTRLFKEIAFVKKAKICDRAVVIGLWEPGFDLEQVNEDGLEITRKVTLLSKTRPNSFFRRFGLFRKCVAIISLFQYAGACIWAARRMNADHVSCHNALMLPVAWVAARLCKATLEYLPHELEVERSGLEGFQKLLTAFFEKTFIRFARNVVVINEPYKKWYQNTYNLKNIYVVRNVPERNAATRHSIPEGDFRYRFKIPSSAKLFIYQGQFSFGRGIEELIEIFSGLDSSKSHIVFMGHSLGEYQTVIDDAVKKNSNVHYQHSVSRDWIVSYSSGADVGIFTVENIPLSYRLSLPNKFFEWAHAGLPVLVSDNFEYMAQLLKEGEFGWSCPFDKVGDFVRRISDADLSTYSENARRFAAQAVWEEDAKAFFDVYRSKGA